MTKLKLLSKNRLEVADKERGTSALAHSYVVRGQRLSQPEAFDKAKKLLTQQEGALTDKGKIESLLLRTKRPPPTLNEKGFTDS